MNPRHWLLIPTTGLALVLGGCGHKETAADHDHDHDHAEHDDRETEGVAFKPGRGLQFPPETVRALQVRTVAAELTSLAAESAVTAQVFATQPRVVALARITTEQTDGLRRASFADARLVRLDASPAAATRLADAVFELDSSPDRRVGEFVTITLQRASSSVLTVPRSAILDSATGTFVYLVKGDAYLRTPVTVGAQTADLAEITTGLRGGDVVVTTPVDQLWLAELRLTKGGGHSH